MSCLLTSLVSPTLKRRDRCKTFTGTPVGTEKEVLDRAGKWLAWFVGLEPADVLRRSLLQLAGRKVPDPTVFGKPERICPIFQRLPENDVWEFEVLSAQPCSRVCARTKGFREIVREAKGPG